MHGSILLVLASVVACTLGAPRVLGGEPAAAGEFPWMASLRRVGNGGHFCGGSIISSSIILTAAHCVVGTSPSSIYVITGSVTLNAGGNRHNVTEVITNSAYNAADSWRNDVAILKLQVPITLGPLEQVVPLPSQDDDAGDSVGNSSRISGWGYTSYPSFALPNQLQKLDLALVPLSKCKSSHSISVYDTQICAGTISGQGVCNGDSGGPLLSNGKQVGIVSWGRSCATGVADVYTRVAAYADWIADNSN